MKDKDGKISPVRGLLDTGTSETKVLKKHVRKGSSKSYKSKPAQWKTMGGVFVTNQKRLLDMSFPALNKSKTVTWACHVDDKTKPENAMCDIILGMDFMTEVGMCVNVADKIIQWEENSLPRVH